MTQQNDAAIAEKVLQDALLLHRVSEKVYRLLLEELRLNRDRTPHFRSI